MDVGHPIMTRTRIRTHTHRHRHTHAYTHTPGTNRRTHKQKREGAKQQQSRRRTRPSAPRRARRCHTDALCMRVWDVHVCVTAADLVRVLVVRRRVRKRHRAIQLVPQPRQRHTATSSAHSEACSVQRTQIVQQCHRVLLPSRRRRHVVRVGVHDRQPDVGDGQAGVAVHVSIRPQW